MKRKSLPPSTELPKEVKEAIRASLAKNGIVPAETGKRRDRRAKRYEQSSNNSS